MLIAVVRLSTWEKSRFSDQLSPPYASLDLLNDLSQLLDHRLVNCAASPERSNVGAKHVHELLDLTADRSCVSGHRRAFQAAKRGSELT